MECVLYRYEGHHSQEILPEPLLFKLKDQIDSVESSEEPVTTSALAALHPALRNQEDEDNGTVLILRFLLCRNGADVDSKGHLYVKECVVAVIPLVSVA